MPVLVDRGPGGCRILMSNDQSGGEASLLRRPAGAEWIEVGIVNNMPETALTATEQQFLQLLSAGAGENWVRVRFFSLPGVPRSERARRNLNRNYFDFAGVGEGELD